MYTNIVKYLPNLNQHTKRTKVRNQSQTISGKKRQNVNGEKCIIGLSILLVGYRSQSEIDFPIEQT